MARRLHPDDVDSPTLAALGLYVSLFSYLEERLEKLRRALVHGGPGGPDDGADTLSYRERIEVVRDLTAVRTPDLYHELTPCLRALEKERRIRNALIHGRWMQDRNGGWRREPLRREDGESWDRHGLLAANSHLRAHLDHLDRLIADISRQTGYPDDKSNR